MAGYSTGGDNLLTSDGTFNYQHDADGNTTVRTRIASTYATDYRTTYIWDYRNRLTDVEYFDNNPGAPGLTKHVHYVYGVFDHLIATEVEGTGNGQYNTVQHYVFDVSPQTPSAGVPGTALAQPVLQFDGSQTLTVRYFVGLDPTGNPAVLAQETVPSTTQAGPVTWAADDNLGTPRDLVNDSGAPVDHRVFKSFGQVADESDPSVAFWVGYAGGHFDVTTGLVNDYKRWYRPATGDWLSQDPSGFGGGDESFGRYVGNDPAGLIDPSGLEFQLPGPNDSYIGTDPDGGGQYPQNQWYKNAGKNLVWVSQGFHAVVVTKEKTGNGKGAIGYIFNSANKVIGTFYLAEQLGPESQWTIVP